MCGISGIVCPKIPIDNNLLLHTITKITDKMAHRGPDGFGYYYSSQVALGHRRLSIIDLSNKAKQPMSSIDQRYTITFNGEIYNYLELKAKLQDYKFTSTSDTEVIIAAYIKWGANCLSYMNGMFSFAIWDEQEKELFIARDRVGIKPFYYYWDKNNHNLLFASEIRALLASDMIIKKIRKQSIIDFLNFQTVLEPYTMVQEIYQLEAGNYGIFKNGHLTIKRYWDLTQPIQTIDDSYEAVKKEVKNKIIESVQLRMVSDVPIAAFLSGGIDSTAIVGIMSELSNQAINTFNISFQESQYSESRYAKAVAQKFATKHYEVVLEPSKLVKHLPDIANSIDSLSGDGINTYIVSEAVQDYGIKVALSGVGGDELFAGYDNFKSYERIQRNKLIQILPSKFRKVIGEAYSAVRPSRRADKLSQLLQVEGFDVEKVFPILRYSFLSDEIKDLINPSFFESEMTNISQNKIVSRHNLSDMPLMSQSSIAEIEYYTRDLLLKDADQMGMKNGLEIREPFFDFHLIEYLMSVPDKYKLSKQKTKPLLVDALNPLIPTDVVFRTKMGFSFPWEQWIRHELKDYCQHHLDNIAKKGIFSPIAIQNLWQSFLNKKKTTNWNQIWLLVILDNWLENNNLYQ